MVQNLNFDIEQFIKKPSRIAWTSIWIRFIWFDLFCQSAWL